MALLSAYRAARVEKGVCVECSEPICRERSDRYCVKHLDYLKAYSAMYRAENPTLKKHKCSICRVVGHSRLQCPKYLAALKG